jgi:hypothetical protein
MLRVDLIFSYWLFLWYILYVFNLTNYNPKIALLCGVVENLIIIGLMVYYNTNIRLLILFVIMFVLLKIIPLVTIWNNPINYKDDIMRTLALFLIYLVWSFYNGKDVDDFIKKSRDLILHNKNTLPGMFFLDKII